MTTFVLSFDSPDATLDQVGGKGANLSRMSRAGFPVPPGFFITTDAYRAFVQNNHLQKQIVGLANNEADTSETKSAAIRRLFANGIAIASNASNFPKTMRPINRSRCTAYGPTARPAG